MKLKLIATGLLALTSVIVQAQTWNLAGNSITTGNFLGTTNDADLIFQRFGQKAGWLGTANRYLIFPGNFY